MLKTIGAFDYVIVGLYFFVMIFCGFLLVSLNKNDKDYFKASGKIPWPMASLSIFIGAFSSYMFTAASGQVYRSGIPAILIYMSSSVGFTICAIYFAKRYRRTRVTSPMEYVEMRFGKLTKSVMTLVKLPILLLSCGNVLYSLCIFISSALGLTEHIVVWGIPLNGLHLAIIVTGIVVIIYTAVGGLWAVIVTDTVQFLIVIVASVLLAILSFCFFSGGDSFLEAFRAYAAHHPVEGYFRVYNRFQPLSLTISWFILQAFSAPGYFPMIQRSACVPTERDAQKSCWLAVVFFVICPLLWLFPVFVLRNHLPDMATLWPHIKNPAEASYVTITLMLLPNGMIGLIIAAILAASISTLAGSLNLVSVIFTNDIYQKVFDKQAGHRRLMLVGKVVSAAAGVIAVVIGIMLSGLADAFRASLMIGSHTGIAICFPVVLGLLFKRTPWWTAIAAIFACLATTLSIELLVPVMLKLSDWPIWSNMSGHMFEYKVCCSTLVTAMVFVVCAFFYTPGNAAPGAEKLFALLQKPVSEDEDHEPVVIPDLKAYRVVAVAMLIFGIPMSLFKLLNIIEDPKFINLYAGAAFLSLSFLIFWLTSTRFSPFKIVRQQKKL